MCTPSGESTTWGSPSTRGARAGATAGAEAVSAVDDAGGELFLLQATVPAAISNPNHTTRAMPELR